MHIVTLTNQHTDTVYSYFYIHDSGHAAVCEMLANEALGDVPLCAIVALADARQVYGGAEAACGAREGHERERESAGVQRARVLTLRHQQTEVLAARCRGGRLLPGRLARLGIRAIASRR